MHMDHDEEHLSQAKKEMVRADHLLYVSLKYSRTVDVIKSVVSRLIDAFDAALVAALELEMSGPELKKALAGAKTKCDAFLLLHPDKKEEIVFYQFLRKLNRAEVEQRLNEFRRHVTLITTVEGEKVQIKIETVEEYYKRVKTFILFITEEVFKEQQQTYHH